MRYPIRLEVFDGWTTRRTEGDVVSGDPDMMTLSITESGEDEEGATCFSEPQVRLGYIYWGEPNSAGEILTTTVRVRDGAKRDCFIRPLNHEDSENVRGFVLDELLKNLSWLQSEV